MSGIKRSAAESSAKIRRSVQAQAIITPHFGFAESALEGYFNRAARRERRKAAEIENTVIRLVWELS